MACTVDISYDPGDEKGLYDIRNYVKSGQWKIKIKVLVGCKGSCPEGSNDTCPPVKYRKTKTVTFDLESGIPSEVVSGSKGCLDHTKDAYERVRQNLGKKVLAKDFEMEAKKIGGGVQKGPNGSDVESRDYGTKSLVELSNEFGIEIINRLKTKAKFTNLCDCDVKTTSIYSAKLLDHIVDEVEKDLFVSKNP